MDEPAFFRREAEQCRSAAERLERSFERHGLIQLALHYEREARRHELAELARKAENVVVIGPSRG